MNVNNEDQLQANRIQMNQNPVEIEDLFERDLIDNNDNPQ